MKKPPFKKPAKEWRNRFVGDGSEFGPIEEKSAYVSLMDFIRRVKELDKAEAEKKKRRAKAKAKQKRREQAEQEKLKKRKSKE